MNCYNKSGTSKITVPEIVQLRALAKPDDLAVVSGGVRLTYRGLEARSNAVSSALRRRGVGKGSFVTLVLERGVTVQILELAVLKTGAAFVPLAEDYPDERIRACIEDTGSSTLVAVKAVLDKRPCLGSLGAEAVALETLEAEGAFDLFPFEPGWHDPAVVVFTSGSTGRPKGVVLDHAALASHIVDLPGNAPYTDFALAGPAAVTVTSVSFVASVALDFLTLVNGRTLVEPTEAELHDSVALGALMEENAVTSMFATPSFLRSFLETTRAPKAIMGLRVILLAGEGVTVDVVRDLHAVNPRLKVLDGYGLSETCAGVACGEVAENDEIVTVGRPLEGTEFTIVDEAGNEVPDGTKGFLLIGGAGLAAEYLGQPEKTSAAFFDRGGVRTFRSGDMAIRLPDGRFQLCGRSDDMVKFHGQRVELGEIETAIRAFPGVRACKAMLRENAGESFLAAFYTAEGQIDRGALATALKRTLPGYMVPSAYMQLDEMPLNASRKIDRQALARLPIEFSRPDYVAPATPLERKLCEEFSQVLSVPNVGATDDFFELGGTSLGVSRLVPRLADIGCSVSFQDVSGAPTPRKLAAIIEAASDDGSWRKLDRDAYPLTKTQLGIWLEGNMSESDSTYTIPYLARAAEGIGPEELVRAVNAVLGAHSGAKCAIFEDPDGTARMHPRPDAEVPMPVTDGPDTQEAIRAFMGGFVRPVAFGDDLLMHFAIYRTPVRCYLAMRLHLILFDGTALSVFISELDRVLGGLEPLGEEISIQQAALREEMQVRNGGYDRAREYYAKLLGTLDDLDPLAGDLTGELRSGESTNLRYEPKTLLAKDVRAFCEKERISESSFFMGAMSILLGKYLNRNDVAFSTVFNGRVLEGLSHTLGTLIQRIPVYGRYEATTPVGDYLRDMGRQIFASMANSICSFDEILRDYPVNEDVEFIFQGDTFTDNMGGVAGEKRIEGDSWYMENIHCSMTTGLMSIQLFAEKGLYSLTVEYRNQRFTPAWIRRFAENLFTIAAGLLKAEKVGELLMVPPEAEALLVRFNDTDDPFSFVPVAAQVHAHALATPDRIAVTADGRSLTYRELDEASDRIASALLRRGLDRGEVVGVMLDRNVSVYEAEIGVLKAGGAFLPFVPSYPDDRIDYCMRDAKCPFVITSAAIRDDRPGLKTADASYGVLAVEELLGEAADSGALGAVEVGPTDLAYVIYTSGSTGRPKGVMIEERNIANYVHRSEKSVELVHYARSGMVSLALASISFDVSVVEEFIPLCNGNTVVMATEEEVHDPLALAKLILDNAVDGITCTPTLLLSLLDIEEVRPALARLTFFDIGAEAFPAQLYSRLRELRTDSVILNVYGPTECTMGCSADIVESAEAEVTVGAPMANTKFYVADKFGNPLPVGVRGELIICGVQVGRGYVNLPDRTAAAFFTTDVFGAPLPAYRSGDLAAWTESGKVRIFGRIDNQIKLRGFRIELDEIEKSMAAYPGVKAAAVAIRKSGTGDFLAGFFTADREIDIGDLTAFLKTRLTEYMVPTAIMRLDEMPMTLNGKVNRKALPTPAVETLQTEYVAPRDDLERKLCERFAQVLGLEAAKVGALDDFFRLGGNSLKTMALVSKSGIDALTIKDVFRGKTPAGIAELLRKGGKTGSTRDLAALEAEGRRNAHRISGFQTLVVDYQFTNPASTMWNGGQLMRLVADVDLDRFAAAVDAAFANHPALSTVFTLDEEGYIVQSYREGLLPSVKIESLSEADLEKLKPTLIAPFRIFGSALCRARLFRTEKAGYLFVDIHHMLVDGVSCDLFVKDVERAYFGEPLPPDHALAYLAETDRVRCSEDYESARRYFHSKYDGVDWCVVPPPDFEADLKVETEEPVVLDLQVKDVIAAADRLGASYNALLIAVGVKALAAYSGKRDILVSWLYDNRADAQYEDSVACMLRLLPIGIQLDQIPDDRALIDEIKRQIADGMANSVYEYFTDRDSLLSTDSMEVNSMLEFGGEEAFSRLAAEPVPLPRPEAATVRMELDVTQAADGSGRLQVLFEYTKDLYRPENVARFKELVVREITGFVKGVKA